MSEPLMRSVYFIVFLTIGGFAAQSVGTITSDEPFQLRGVLVPVAGVSNWPLAPCDEVATPQSSAEIRFTDGSRVTLDRGSKAVVECKAGGPVLRLTVGAAWYKLTTNSQVVLIDGQKTLTSPGSSGFMGSRSGSRSVVGRAPEADGPPPEPPPVSGSVPPIKRK